MNPVMTYDENYGHLPAALLALFKVRNVSPADYFGMEVCIGEGEFERFYNHVESNLIGSFYSMPFPFTE